MGDHGYHEPEPCTDCSQCVCDWLLNRTKHKRDCVLHHHDYDDPCDRCAQTIVHYHRPDEWCPGIFLEINKTTLAGRDAVYTYPTAGESRQCGDGYLFCCQAFDDALAKD
jgi:hypothetical protein